MKLVRASLYLNLVVKQTINNNASDDIVPAVLAADDLCLTLFNYTSCSRSATFCLISSWREENGNVTFHIFTVIKSEYQ